MIENCATKPSATGRGIPGTRRKPPTLRVMPRPSMITPSPHTINGPLNQVNHCGTNSASTPPASTQMGKALVR